MRYSYKSWLIGIILIAGWALWKCQFGWDPNTSFAEHSDGWGTIGWMYDYSEAFSKGEISDLAGEFYQAQGIGGQLNTRGIPGAQVVRVLYGALGHFFGAENTFDIAAFISYFLYGFSGWLLGKSIGLRPLWSCLMAITFMATSYFDQRMRFHIGLMFIFPCLMVVGAAYSYTQRQKLSTALFLGGSFWLCFNFAEYYGFLGFVIVGSSLLIVGILSKNRRLYGIHGCACLCLLLALMLTTYPKMISGAISSFFSSENNVLEAFNRPISEVEKYSITNPLQTFMSDIPIVKYLFPTSLSSMLNIEFSYFLGGGVFLVLFGALVIYAAKCAQKKEFHYSDSGVFLIVCSFFGLFIALPPSISPFSELVVTILPVIRVLSRGTLFAQIALLMLTFLVLNRLTNKKSFKNYGAAFALFALVFLDLRPARFGAAIDPFPVSGLYNKEVYEVLKEKPHGWVLELPYHFPHNGFAENDYLYYIGRLRHQKPIINGGFGFQGDDVFYLERLGKYRSINQFNVGHVAKLREIGVRYLVVHKGKAKLGLLQYDGLRLQAETKDGFLYEILDAKKYSKSKLVEWLEPKELIFTADTLHSQINETSYSNGKRTFPGGVNNGVFFSFGPYIPLKSGRYRATKEIRLDGVFDESRKIMQIDAVSTTEGGLVVRDVSREDLDSDDVLKIDLDFEVKKAGIIEIRSRALQRLDLSEGPLMIRSVL